MRPREVLATLTVWLVGLLVGTLASKPLGVALILVACGWGALRVLGVVDRLRGRAPEDGP